VLWVAAGIGVHAPPLASQRDHAYANVMPLPVHVPGFAVSVWPTTVDSTIVGGCVFGGPACPLTTSVAFEATVAAPSAFDAVTRTRRREPTSPDATTYAVVEAPPMTAQSEPSGAPPDAGQRTHWYANVGLPVHVPGAAVRVCPSDGMPVIVGATVFEGTAYSRARRPPCR
jgi:hypothetical protein